MEGGGQSRFAEAGRAGEDDGASLESNRAAVQWQDAALMQESADAGTEKVQPDLIIACG
jgi:hypothetical protein